MDWTLRELRYFVAVADAGSFTDAASHLFVSQAAVSRTIAALERRLAARLFNRVSSGCVLARAGAQLLPAARRVTAEATRFTEFASTRRAVLRVSYAWAALGVHTAPLLRDWPAVHAGVELELSRSETLEADLVSGSSDVVIVRKPLTGPGFASVELGQEARTVAFAADRAEWSRRRKLTLAEIAQRTVIVDSRSGSTDTALWQGQASAPTFRQSSSVDQWLDLISADRGVGVTAEATSHHHRRDGVTYRLIADAPPVSVQLVWRAHEQVTGLDELIARARALYAS